MPATKALSKFQTASSKARLEWVMPDFNGVDNNSDPSSIGDDKSPDALNVIFDSNGSVATRKGYSKLLTTTYSGGAILGMRALYKSDAITKQLVYFSGTDFLRYDNAGGSVKINSVNYTTGKQWDSDIYLDKMYAGNGVDPLQAYDFTTIANVSGAAGITPQYVRVHKNRTWLANANSSRLYFSNAGDPNTYPVNNFIDINTNDGQVITGLEELTDALVIWKTDSIWIVQGEPLGAGNTTTLGNLQMRRLNSDVGCVAFRTICKVQGVIFFMARSGVFVLQNYQTQLISKDVNGTFRGMNTNTQNASWACYSALEKKYILNYPDGAATTPNKCIVYDTLVKGWAVWDDIPGSCGTNFKFNNTDTMVFGDAVKGIVYKMFQNYNDIAGDNGQASSTGSTTALNDASKAWTTNGLVDAKVYIINGTNAGQTAVITANTATQITFSPAMTLATDSSCVYTIGGYAAYWKTKISDFSAPQMTKKYKYWNIFADSATGYNLMLGISLGFAPLTFNAGTIALTTAGWLWDQVAPVWDAPGYFWDPKASLFKRANIGGQERHIQLMFGNVAANQPFRVFTQTISYKEKKARPS